MPRWTPLHSLALLTVALVAGCGEPKPQAQPEPPRTSAEGAKSPAPTSEGSGTTAAKTEGSGTEAPSKPAEPASSEPKKEVTEMTKDSDLPKNNEEWKKVLTQEQYNVLRQKGTERAFTGTFWNNHKAGTYRCAGCGQELFSSDAKFDSGTGWPSYFKPVKDAAVKEHDDRTHGMVRTEVTCSRCGGHLGHVFDDGPEPTGLRYCINSVSLKFEPKDEK